MEVKLVPLQLYSNTIFLQLGSGKTAAYLIALFEELKRKELQLNSSSFVLSKTISSSTVLETTAAPQLLNDLDSNIDKGMLPTL